MRLKIILLLLLPSFLSVAQEKTIHFSVKSTQALAQNALPFYDVDVHKIQAIIQFKGTIDSSKYKMIWSIQPRTNTGQTYDIYLGYLPSLPYPKAIINIPINDTLIKSGNYQLKFRLFSNEEQLISEKGFAFQILRNKNDFYRDASLSKQKEDYLQENNVDIGKTFVAQYDADRLRKNILALNPICNKVEVRVIYQITQEDNLEFAQRFFYNFWTTRNPNNPEAEWKAYAKKLNLVAKKYGGNSLPGYQSDRGKVFLKHGPPNHIVQANNEQNARPYEIWFYNEMGKYNNLAILFVQVGRSSNDRVIAHSTDPSFFGNPSWPQQIFLDMSETQNKFAHKAYDFFQ